MMITVFGITLSDWRESTDFLFNSKNKLISFSRYDVRDLGKSIKNGVNLSQFTGKNPYRFFCSWQTDGFEKIQPFESTITEALTQFQSPQQQTQAIKLVDEYLLKLEKLSLFI